MIPAGINIGETEFFWNDSNGFVMESGQSSSLSGISASAKTIVDSRMNKIHHAALDEMGLKTPDERRNKFLQCNSSAYDFTPDIKDGQMQLEYVSCPLRGICPQEGRLCQPLVINGQKISMKELQVISGIRRGLYDKEICEELNIKIQTLRTHKQSIQRKLQADRKVEVALAAVKYGIY